MTDRHTYIHTYRKWLLNVLSDVKIWMHTLILRMVSTLFHFYFLFGFGVLYNFCSSSGCRLQLVGIFWIFCVHNKVCICSGSVLLLWPFVSSNNTKQENHEYNITKTKGWRDHLKLIISLRQQIKIQWLEN